MIASIENALNLTTTWFLYSGIQNIQASHLIDGGFNSWFNAAEDSYGYVYSEITGYAITKLLYLYNLDHQEISLERANLAASYLLDNTRHETGAVKSRYYFKQSEDAADFSQKEGTLYTFDTGMVLFGIVNLYKVTKDKKYLEFAKDLARFLEFMYKGDGSFYAYYDPEKDEKVDNTQKWSTQSGAYHAKLALGLLTLFEITGERKYEKMAEESCKYALNYQKDSGRFVTMRDSNDTLLHPHCYACEALYFTGAELRIEGFVEAAKRGIEWSFEGQLDSGGIPSMYYEEKQGFGKYERADALAQVLRLGAVLLGSSYEERLERLAKRLLEFQSEEDSVRIKGGFRYGHTRDGKKIDHVNSWCSMFAYQALKAYLDRRQSNQVKLDLLV